MEILYIYIQEFEERVTDQGLNFGGKYRFNYDKRSGTLTVKENPFYIPSFFNFTATGEQRALIKNVTAIIGQNGAGKTTILEFFRSNFVSGLNGVRSPLILAIENDEGAILVYHYQSIPIHKGNYHNYNVTLRPIGPKLSKIQSEAPGLRFETNNPPVIHEFEAVHFIYFSNIFDGALQIALDGIYDLSTNYLIRQDLINNLENHFVNTQLPHREIESHIYEDIERQIAFINGYDQPTLISFDLPKILFVSSKRDLLDPDFALDQSEQIALDDYAFMTLTKRLIEITKCSIDREKSWVSKAACYFTGLAVVNFIIEIATHYNPIKDEFLFISKPDDNSPDDVDIRVYAVQILTDFKEQTRHFKVNLEPRTVQWIDALIAYLHFLPDILQEDLIVSEKANSFAINVRQKPDQFRRFYELYSGSYLLRPSLNFVWGGLSSGEMAFLKMYARFFTLANSQVRAANGKLRKTVVVLIDEGDLYLHPGWQKEFIFTLLNFLSSIYAATPEGHQRTIQIILTTNSPIPSSDLPNTNIIFLERKDKSIVIRDSLDDRKATFGANIHTLLADSFYLRDGTMGNFARHKINEVIEILQEEKEIETKKELIQNIISVIGEPLIRAKLTQMLQERLFLDQVSLSERVAQLDQRVRQLEGRTDNPSKS
jgi:hypothetical protein